MKALKWMLVFLIAAGGCSSAKNAYHALGELQQLQSDLVTQTRESNISVRIVNGRYLTIGLINSDLKDLPAGPKKEKALEIAKYAFDHYKDRDRLEAVGVSFVVYKSYVIFHYTNSTDCYNFRTTLLKASTERNGPERRNAI